MSREIFQANDSASLARSIAKRGGIKIVKARGTATRPMVTGTTITIHDTTIYNHTEYMEHLHGAIGKVCKENEFFNEVITAEPRKDTWKEIIRDLHCDKYLNGEYAGRDRQLASGYKKRAVSLETEIENIANVDPTAAALLTAGNELRGTFQGFNKVTVPESIKPLHDKIVSTVGPKWLSLETREDVEGLLKFLEEQEDGQSSSDASDSGGSEEGGEEKSSKGRDNGQEPAGDDRGDEKGDSSDQSGEGKQGPEGSDGESTPNGSGEGEPGEGEGEPGEQEGEPGESESEGEGSPEQSYIPEEQGEGESEETGDNFTAGYGDVGNKLRELGLIQNPGEPPPQVSNKVPYVPSRNIKVTKVKDGDNISNYLMDDISKKLGGLKLSQQMRKYLVAMTQTRTQVGLRKGKLDPSKITRMYANTGHNQPRMFKDKKSSRVTTDIAISLVVDFSGSMDGEKYAMATACAIATSEVLQAIGVAHEIMGFTTGYNDEILHFLIKGYEERFVSRDKMIKRFSLRFYSGANADGESIMWAAERAMQRTEKDKLLIVFSDGAPAFNGGHGSSHTYLKDVVTLIESTPGIDVLGVGIQSNAVKNYYTRCKVLRDLSQLEPIVLDLLKEKLIRN